MNRKNQSTQKTEVQHHAENFQASGMDDGVKIDGLAHVVDLLKYADPAFRESLIRRLAQKDPTLANRLKKMIR